VYNPDLYDEAFYAQFPVDKRTAADVLLKEIWTIHPFASMVDFGCGAGVWLQAARHLITASTGPPARIFGVDGPHVRRLAACPGASFHFQDLEAPVAVSERYDLAISLEVAEHLTPARAQSFVEDICRTSDVVLFGAAIPGQGGVGHLNEQWQDYWVKIFRSLEYRPYDVLREKYWADPRLHWCPQYVANALLFVKVGHPLGDTIRSKEVTESWQLRVVHPRVFQITQSYEPGFLTLLGALPGAFRKAIAKRLDRVRARFSPASVRQPNGGAPDD
jgi:SAM-dependent methyltransferase